jgi:hypothetical protein
MVQKVRRPKTLRLYNLPPSAVTLAKQNEPPAGGFFCGRREPQSALQSPHGSTN